MATVSLSLAQSAADGGAPYLVATTDSGAGLTCPLGDAWAFAEALTAVLDRAAASGWTPS